MKKLIALIALALTLTACGGEQQAQESKEEAKQEEPAQKEKSNEMSFDEKKTATGLPLEIYNVVTGDGNIAGQMSVLTLPEAEITDEYIKTWYSKIQGLNNNYDIIISKESVSGDKAKGVMNMSGLVTKNCEFTKGDDGVYVMTNDENGEIVNTK